MKTTRYENLMSGGMYRSRHGVLLGICRGLADYFDFSVFWVRSIVLILFVFTGFWPTAVLYFIAALVMKPEPVVEVLSEDEREFYDSYVHSRKGAVNRIKRRYENLDRRIRRMEDIVTSREYDFERRLNA